MTRGAIRVAILLSIAGCELVAGIGDYRYLGADAGVLVGDGALPIPVNTEDGAPPVGDAASDVDAGGDASDGSLPDARPSCGVDAAPCAPEVVVAGLTSAARVLVCNGDLYILEDNLAAKDRLRRCSLDAGAGAVCGTPWLVAEGYDLLLSAGCGPYVAETAGRILQLGAPDGGTQAIYVEDASVTGLAAKGDFVAWSAGAGDAGRVRWCSTSAGSCTPATEPVSPAPSLVHLAPTAPITLAWATGVDLSRCTAVGTSCFQRTDGPGTAGRAKTLGVDLDTNGNVYGLVPSQILVSSKGAAQTSLAPLTTPGASFVYDGASLFYVASTFTGTIEVVDVAGAHHILYSGLPSLGGLTLDGDHLYWTEDTRVRRARLR